MTEAQEVRARAKALRERREELEKALAGAAGPGARPLRLELARVKEELVDGTRRLKERMPSHKVRCRTTWAVTAPTSAGRAAPLVSHRITQVAPACLAARTVCMA